MKQINKKVNELYVSKKVTLSIPYRGRTREITYMITGLFGTEMRLGFKLRSIKFPCEIPYLHTIQMQMNNEFPNQPLKKTNK